MLIIRLGKPVEKGALASFLEVAKDHVEQQAAGYGPNQLLPSGMFEWDLGERLEIDAKTSPALIAPMTWSIFVDAIGGLREFLVGLKSGREAACRVMIGDAFGLFAGYVELRTRVPAPKAHIARDVPILPVVNDPKL